MQFGITRGSSEGEAFVTEVDGDTEETMPALIV